MRCPDPALAGAAYCTASRPARNTQRVGAVGDLRLGVRNKVTITVKYGFMQCSRRGMAVSSGRALQRNG